MATSTTRREEQPASTPRIRKWGACARTRDAVFLTDHGRRAMPSEVRFALVRKMLEDAGWTLVRINGSHHYFTRPGSTPLSIPVHGNKVKPIYVTQIRKQIEEDQGRS